MLSHLSFNLRREAAPHATQRRQRCNASTISVSISDEKPLHMRRLAYQRLHLSLHYSGTLKSRHFPWNCPRNIPVQKESWKDISKEPPFPRNSPWNLPRSRKDLRAV